MLGTTEEIDQSRRYRMLSMRRIKVPEFKNYRMIPSLEKEIPKGIIEAREKRVVANRKELFGSGDPVRGTENTRKLCSSRGKYIYREKWPS